MSTVYEYTSSSKGHGTRVDVKKGGRGIRLPGLQTIKLHTMAASRFGVGTYGPDIILTRPFLSDRVIVHFETIKYCGKRGGDMFDAYQHSVPNVLEQSQHTTHGVGVGCAKLELSVLLPPYFLWQFSQLDMHSPRGAGWGYVDPEPDYPSNVNFIIASWRAPEPTTRDPPEP